MRVVVKVGTNVLSNSDGTLNPERIQALVKGLVQWHNADWQVVIVSSGAIGAGMGYLGFSTRPQSVRDKQAAASVGQVRLMEIYNTCFQRFDVHIGQVLLTREDLMDHKRYLNTRNTLMTLLDRHVIPVINENDTVSIDEIILGDNDMLAAIVAMKVEAQKLLILTDVDGVCSYDNQTKKRGACIPLIEKITPEIEKLCTSRTGSIASTGGMLTKIQAAKIATRAGVEVIIANGLKEDTLDAFFAGRTIGTTFVPEKKTLKSKKRWIAFGAKIKGKIVIDNGAAEAIMHRGKSLLPAGITAVEGNFSRGEMVSIVDSHNHEIARGISSFSSGEVNKIKGEKSSRIKEILQRDDQAEVIHRDNLVIL